ncbi:MAG: hypothetical protein U0800_27075 [Isosphaeraceae bacterium]
MRTSEGTIDGVGMRSAMSTATRTSVNQETGFYILEGPEFLSIFGNKTGRELEPDRLHPAARFPTGATTTAIGSTGS